MPSSARARRDLDLPARRRGVERVHEQGEQGLPELAVVGVHVRERGIELEGEAHLLELHLVADEVGRLLGERVEVGVPHLGPARAAEVEQRADDLLAAEDLLVDGLQVAREVLEGVDGEQARVLGRLQQALRAQRDGGQRGVDLVGDAGGELADVGQARRSAACAPAGRGGRSRP